MKLGAVYPQTETKGSPEWARKIILSVENMGLDHLLTYDHPVGADHADREPPLTGPYTLEDSFHDPFTFLTFAAALTKRIELFTGVLIMPQRQTVLVAKQATDLALFSGNRFRLGVGTGWNWVEYDALGREFARRGPMLDEQIPLLRRLWTERVVTHRGSVELIERAGLVVQPDRPIPIWLGGRTEPAFRRAGRLGDGFIFTLRSELTLEEQWERLRQHLAANGKAESSFGRNVIVSTRDSMPQAAAEIVLRWRDAGHTHATVDSTRHGFESPEQHLDYFGVVQELLR